MNYFRTSVGLAAAIAGVLASGAVQPSPARAGLGDCGNIHVEAEAMCELVPPGATCEGMCTPVSVRAACEATLAADCMGQCDDLPSVSCEGECTGDCMAECEELEPGSLNCQGSCEADCSGRCEASCEGNEDRASCEASCEGSCEADANFDCQIDCQAEASADCEAEVTGGCELECDTEEGALFCDSQYVDHGNNLDDCLAALRAEYDIEVESEASGEASCGDGEGCRAEGEASAKVTSECSVRTPGRGGAHASVVFAGLWMLAGLVRVRRRAR